MCFNPFCSFRTIVLLFLFISCSLLVSCSEHRNQALLLVCAVTSTINLVTSFYSNLTVSIFFKKQICSNLYCYAHSLKGHEPRRLPSRSNNGETHQGQLLDVEREGQGPHSCPSMDCEDADHIILGRFHLVA